MARSCCAPPERRLPGTLERQRDVGVQCRACAATMRCGKSAQLFEEWVVLVALLFSVPTRSARTQGVSMRLGTKVVGGLFLIVAGAILSRPIIDYVVNKNPLPGNNPQDELSSERSRIMSPETIVKLVNPRPGSTVLDLGAGFGFNTFRLGQAVGPGGKVFATDVDSQAIAFLNERVREEGAKNVVPVQVSGHGVDSFYRNHEFDLILASDVITEIRSPETFFDELRPFLKEGTGRLWVVNLRSDPEFTALEFGDASRLRSALNSDGVQATIMHRLSPATRQALQFQATTNTPEPFVNLAIADLNTMLEDPSLWPEIRDQKRPLNRQDAKLRDVLVRALDKKGAFTAQAAVTAETRHLLRLLNRLVIADLLGSEMWGRAIALNKLSKPQLKPLLAPLAFPTFWGQPPFLEKVGYELVQEHTNMTYCAVWEFRRMR